MKDVKHMSMRFVNDIPGGRDMIQSPTHLFSVRSPFISLVLNNVSKWKWRGISGRIKLFSMNTTLYKC